jgi:hypothetical protein
VSEILRGSRTPFPQAIQAQPHDDVVQIGPKAGRGLISLGGLEDPEKRFLGHVFRGLPTTEHPVRRPPGRRLMAQHDFLESR